jgi:hypothetical protein
LGLEVEIQFFFFLGFKMLLSFTCTIQPEAGDLGRLLKKLGLAKVGTGRGAILGEF